MNERKSPVSNVTVVIGAGSIGQAIARRVSAGKHVLLADLREENAAAAAQVLSNAGFEVSTATIDVSSRESEAPPVAAGFGSNGHGWRAIVLRFLKPQPNPFGPQVCKPSEAASGVPHGERRR